MKKTLYSLIAILTLTSLVFITSCKKEDNVDTQTVEGVIDADNAAAEGVVLAQQNAGNDKEAYANSCMTVTRTIDLDHKKVIVTIEFNGTCDDGIQRSGKMTIVADLGWRINPLGKGITITYDHFTRGRRIFDGTISYSLDVVTDTTTDSSMAIVMNTMMDNFKVSFPDSTSITLSGNKTIEFMHGFFTFWNKKDDVLKISANVEGINRKGDKFASISQDVIIKRDCNFFFPVSGTKTINFEDGRTYIIDFGDGTCDRIYTVTYNGKTYTREFDPNE